MEIYNQYIVTKLYESLRLEEPKKEKKSFWATDSEKPLFDLYHEWIGTPPTNPIEPEKAIMFNAAKMIEIALIEKLTKLGITQDLKEQKRIEMTRCGVPISGYIDGVFVDGTPLEIKTFYGDYQAQELKALKPKTSYLKQLAIYMDFLVAKLGKLIYMDRGTGEMYEFTLTRTGDFTYECCSIKFNLLDTYMRWKMLYENHIISKIEPTSEFKYKYPLELITQAPKSVIALARNNRAVYGDWQVKYSPYKNLIISREGTTVGYSEEEIKKIKELTDGYTSRKTPYENKKVDKLANELMRVINNNPL